MQFQVVEASPAVEVASDIEVSIVMPCLNEACTVGVCVEKAVAELQRLGVCGEILVADNGSTDGSQEIARSKGARIVVVEKRGYGSALQAGIAAARGRYIIMGDSDDSYDFSNLAPFIERLRQGDDLVMGNRFRGGIKPGAMPWLHRYVGNPVLTGILNLFFRSPISDAHCGLRGFRKEAVQQLDLKTPGMEFASEMVVKACLRQQKISEVPIVLHPDGRDRPPHLRSFRDGWRHLRFLLLMCPLWLYRVPSMILMALGLLLMAVVTPGPCHVFGMGLDVHAMLLGSLGVVVGYQTFWLWAFARFYGATIGLLPPDPGLNRVIQFFFLERGLIVGGALMLVGLALNLWALNLDHLSEAMRFALWGFTALVLGVQTIYGSFFLSTLKMGVRSPE